MLFRSVTFPSGSAETTVYVKSIGDTIGEPDETVELTLAAGTGYAIGTSTTAVGTILDDNLPRVSVLVDYSTSGLPEDGIGLKYSFYRQNRESYYNPFYIFDSPLTVNYRVGGTATLGEDYTGIAQTPAVKIGRAHV